MRQNFNVFDSAGDPAHTAVRSAQSQACLRNSSSIIGCCAVGRDNR
jgi:hypothetical protein